MIIRNPSVVDVKLFPDEDAYFVEILFDGGGSLQVSDVNENGTGNMKITLVNDYDVLFCAEEFRPPLGRRKVMQLYSIIAGEQLETIIDIVNNYHKINRFVNNLPDLNNFKNAEDKNFSEVIDRLIYVDKLFSNNIFLIDGYKYHLFKINIDILLDGGFRAPRSYGGRPH
jgi:hypothetical protein